MSKSITLLIIILLFSPALFGQENNQEEEALYVAKKAYADGFYEVSLNLLQRFLTNFPQSQKIPEANLYIAQCYFQQNEFIACLAQLEKLSHDPNAEPIIDAVFYWTGEVHFAGRDFSKAISFYQRIIDRFPDSALRVHAYYSRGWCLFELGQYHKAIDDFTKVISDFPDDPLAKNSQAKNLDCLYRLEDYQRLNEEIANFQKKYPADTTYTSSIHFFLAEHSLQLDNLTEAIERYQLALNSSPDQEISVFSKLRLAQCYLKLKKYVEAKDLLESIVIEGLTDRQQEELLLAKANLFTEIEDFANAQAVWSELKKISTQPPIKMQAYLGEGKALYNSGQYKEAVAVYQQAQSIAQEGLSPQLLDELYYELAWAYLKNGQFKQAIDEFQKAASFASDEIVKVTALCQVGDAYQDTEEYEKAIQVYDQILKDYPDSFYVDYVQYQLGIACLRSSRYDEAIIALRTLLLNFPKSKLKTQAIYSLALGFFQKQNYQGAQVTLEKHLPDLNNQELEVDALYLLATSYYNLGKYQEALDVFQEVIRESGEGKISQKQKAEYEIADCFYQMGNEKEALRRFNVLRAKYPDSTLNPEVTYWLGGYYSRKGDFELSRRYLSTIIRDFPQSSLVADAYYSLGLLEREEGELDLAIENLQKVMEIGSRDLLAQAGIVIADILIEQAKLDEAEFTYQEAIKKSPALAGLIYPKIARIYEQKGDFIQAIRFYQEAISLLSMKEAASLQFKIAQAYETHRDYHQAIEEYLKIPYLYPMDAQLTVKAYLSGAQIYENQEDWLAARDIYLKVASMDVEEAKYAQERLTWIDSQMKTELSER
ncbi:MAG: tetratricopeptide repeat protein [Candidatus Omnitrophota bacterium]|jgi:tetratricopeptide (TPR) repeat protein